MTVTSMWLSGRSSESQQKSVEDAALAGQPAFTSGTKHGLQILERGTDAPVGADHSYDTEASTESKCS